MDNCILYREKYEILINVLFVRKNIRQENKKKNNVPNKIGCYFPKLRF